MTEHPATGTRGATISQVFDYPTFPIVGTLGLIPESCDNTGPYPIFTLKPIDPFLVSGKMVGDAGLEMCSRVGTHWRRNPTFDAAISNIRKVSARKQIAHKRKKRGAGNEELAIANLTIPFDSIDDRFRKRSRSNAELRQFPAGNHVVEQSGHHHPSRW